MRPRDRLRKRSPLNKTSSPPPFLSDSPQSQSSDPGPRWVGAGQDHWDHHLWNHLREHHKHFKGPHSRRPGFFMKISGFFFVLCLALVITLSTGDGFTWKHLFHAMGWILLIFFIAFMGLRRMFGPMRYLMRGVHELSNGNLDFRFPPKGRGEFDFLAYNFNHMADRVRAMIQSKDQLLLDVSHELRSPLTRSKVALELTPRNKLKTSMMRDISEMETMLTEILETEHLKRDHGKLVLEPLDLSSLMRDMIAKYKDRKPGIKLLGNPSGFLVQADRTRINTVFQNILENALKYSEDQKKPVEVEIESKDGRVGVLVRDHGVGIPPEDQEKVFEPFYRVDKSRTKETGGYGLGLSLCREIMKAHGGEISLESGPGRGTGVLLKFKS